MEGAAVEAFEWNTGEWGRMYGKGVVGRVVGASVPSAQLARSRGRNRKSCEYRRQLLSVNVETGVRSCACACTVDYTTPGARTLQQLYLYYYTTVPSVGPPALPSSSPARPYLQYDSTIKPISISVIRVRSIFSTYLTAPTLSSHSRDPADELIYLWVNYEMDYAIVGPQNSLTSTQKLLAHYEGLFENYSNRTQY